MGLCGVRVDMSGSECDGWMLKMGVGWNGGRGGLVGESECVSM